MKNRLIIFDCFGVIFGEIAPVFFERHFDKETAAVLKDKYFIPADLGIITREELFDLMAEELGFPKDELLKEWESLIRLDMKMVETIKELKKEADIALLSNAPTGFVEKLFEENNLYPLFDKVCVSSAVKMAKPDAAIYKYCVDMFGKEYDKIYFIDDSAKNLAPLEELGITGIHFVGIEDMIERLK